MSLLKKIFHLFPQRPHYYFPWKQTCTLCRFSWFFFFFLRIISPKIKEFFSACLLDFYMDLSNEWKANGVFNNPAPLCTDLTEEPTNLALVVRQGGCWTRSTSVWFLAFQDTFLLFSPAEDLNFSSEWTTCYLLDISQYSHVSFGKECIYVCANVHILGRKL